MKPAGTPRPRARYAVALLLLLWLPVFELGSFVATRLLSERGFFYLPHDGAEYQDYLSKRDPLLGWPAPNTFGTGEFDEIGSRVIPDFPDPHASPACVSFFGDSFTFGAEVEPIDSYPNQVARRLGCRVHNFGVGGYGTDQALLRYRDGVQQQAPFVVLGHYTENIIRNINQYRDYLGGTFYGLKPRFVLDDAGALQLVPLPTPTPEQFVQIAAGDPVTLDHEYLYPGGPAGIVTRRFPYSWSALRFLGQYRVRAVVRGVPSYAQFYEPEHPSRALAVTQAILEEFVRVARERGQTPLVVLIPDIKDMQMLRDGQPAPYEPLLSRLHAAQIDVLAIGPELLAQLGEQPPSELYYGQGHFNPRGYAAVAQLVADRIRAKRDAPAPSSGIGTQ